MDNGQYVHHVGFLEKPVDAGKPAADWWVVEAQGVLSGVVRTRLSERRWNKWGWMTKYFDYSACAKEEDQQKEYGDRNLRRGMNGEDVAALQADLIALGFTCGDSGIDGDFGRETEKALIAFQTNYRLEVDGIAGPETYGKLDELIVETGEEAEEKEEAEPEKTIRISAGRTWNVRTAPNATATIRGIASYDEWYAPGGQSADGWVSILYDGKAAWISEKAVAA